MRGIPRGGLSRAAKRLLPLLTFMTVSTYAALDDWIAREAIPFSPDSPGAFSTAIDKVTASLGDTVELLGLG